MAPILEFAVEIPFEMRIVSFKLCLVVYLCNACTQVTKKSSAGGSFLSQSFDSCSASLKLLERNTYRTPRNLAPHR